MILNTLCPACRRKAFDLLVKVMMGPAAAVACPSCGESIGVSVWPHAVGVVAFISFVLYSATEGAPMADGKFAGVVFAALVLAWGVWFLQAPLVRKMG